MTRITWAQHLKTMEDFRQYSELLEEADEMEIMVKWLVDCPHPDYVSEEFQQSYFKEMQEQLKWFSENAEICVAPERKLTQTVPGRKYLKYEHD